MKRLILLAFAALAFLLFVAGRSSVDAPGRAPTPATATVNNALAPPVSAPNNDTQVRAYAAGMAKPVADYSTFLNAFLNQNQQLAGSPGLMLNGAWEVQTAAALLGMQSAARDMAAVPVPAALSGAGPLMRDIQRETDGLIQNYTHGIDTHDASLIRAATAHMDQITADSLALHRLMLPYE